MHIIRRENGSLHQLAAELMDLSRGMVAERGSLILLFSGTHMARARTVGYIEDLLAASASNKSVMGQELRVAPLPLMFLGGCNSPEVLRIAAEVSAWAQDVYRRAEGFIVESYKLALECIQDDSDGAQSDYKVRMRLPVALAPAAGKKCWVMSGFHVKKNVEPLKEEKEKELMQSLVQEIWSKMAINLGPDPQVSRVIEEAAVRGVATSKLYLVIGGDHAFKLTETMRRRGDTPSSQVGGQRRLWWRFWLRG
jgi:hypothetical protein